MTERQRRAIERARKTSPQFIDIERTCRSTAARNTLKALAEQRAASIQTLFETERQRLIKTWGGEMKTLTVSELRHMLIGIKGDYIVTFDIGDGFRFAARAIAVDHHHERIELKVEGDQ